jgi:hypothetical protein
VNTNFQVWVAAGSLFTAILVTIGLPLFMLVEKTENLGQRISDLDKRVFLLEYLSRVTQFPEPSR